MALEKAAAELLAVEKAAAEQAAAEEAEAERTAAEAAAVEAAAAKAEARSRRRRTSALMWVAWHPKKASLQKWLATPKGFRHCRTFKFVLRTRAPCNSSDHAK